MMSTQDEVSLVVKCLRLGAADYLVKPLRTNELLNLWTHMWRRRRMVSFKYFAYQSDSWWLGFTYLRHPAIFSRCAWKMKTKLSLFYDLLMLSIHSNSNEKYVYKKP